MSSVMEAWKGRTFQGKTPVKELPSDSSQEAWAGVDVTTGRLVQEFWRDKRGLHINVKELEAAINTVQSLAKEKEHVLLKADNSVTYAYLTKGGGNIPTLNQQIRQFFEMVHGKANNVDSSTGQNFRVFSTWPQQMVQGQG